MGMVISSVEKIDNIHWADPSAIGSSPKVVFLTKADGIIVAKLANGCLWSPSINKFGYLPGMWRWTPGLLKCLVRLDVITKADADEHLAICKRADEATSRRYDAEELRRLQKKYGGPKGLAKLLLQTRKRKAVKVGVA